MKRITILALILCSCSVLWAQQTVANATNGSNVVVPPLVNFSSVLTDLNGKPLTGITGVTFLLYKEEQGGAPLWLETQNVQADEQGNYTVLLGATKNEGMSLDLFTSGESRWLGESSFESLTPRAASSDSLAESTDTPATASGPRTRRADLVPRSRDGRGLAARRASPVNCPTVAVTETATCSKLAEHPDDS